ncbi:peroxisome biogenesis factor 2-like isoform X3 [Euwallacea fornicatus]|uniref:peroxisome biogenesis factor 2-like isoform X3 n=1 Tax=Euwallacea fornicatus TaxID=995702 RepID=UPI00338E38FF
MSRNNLLRVTQMNAIYLDREIEKSFQQIIEDTIKHLPPSMVSPVHTEINLLIRLGLLKYSVFDKGSTFGQQLLNIKYQDISAFKKSLYLIFSSLEYVKCRCELWNPSHSINKIFLKWHILIKILDLINTAIFLRHGVKPLLIERVLGLNQIYSSQKSARTFESKYLARELLWNGFIRDECKHEMCTLWPTAYITSSYGLYSYFLLYLLKGKYSVIVHYYQTG